MRNSLCVLATLVLVSCAQVSSAVDVVIGSFEGSTLGGGWTDWQGVNTYENSTTGATLGSNSIKIIPDQVGYQQGLAVKLQNLPNNTEAFDGFVNNTHIAFDITWDVADWDYLDSGWNGARIMLLYNEQGAGWSPPLGINPDENGFYQPNIDTGNPTNQGFWDIVNYGEPPGGPVHTRTVMWDYSHLLPLLTSTATGGWIEFITVTNAGNFAPPVAYYIDNVRFTTPEMGIDGDYNGDGTVDAGDYVRWRNNLGDADETNINNNGDGGDVGISDYQFWKDRYGNPGAGGLGTVVPEPAAVLAGLWAVVLISFVRRRAR